MGDKPASYSSLKINDGKTTSTFIPFLSSVQFNENISIYIYIWWKNLGILVVQRIVATEDRHDRRLCLV